MNNTSESEACKNARAEAMAVLCDKCRGQFDRRLREAEPAFHYIEDYIVSVAETIFLAGGAAFAIDKK